MERDSRRDRGEWRGCHNFDKIICDGDVPTSSERRGGLKMGQRYYYYYELDGSTEAHNPSLPTTTACPFLPGQTVNTLDVPLERRTRMKSASMNSLRNTEYKTMDPVDRFTTPRPAPIPNSRREFRIASASSILPKRATRSVSPAPSWTGTARRILGFKLRDREAERGRKSNLGETDDVFVEVNDPFVVESRSVTPSGSIRSRDMSPESLRKFLSDDMPAVQANAESTPGFSIPDDIEEEIEENDDDDNFANTAVSENNSFTNLSPPPFQIGGLSAPPASHTRNAIQTLTPPVFSVEGSLSTAQRSKYPTKLEIPRSHSTLSVASSSMASAASAQSNISQSLSQFSFFDDSDDEEDLASYAGGPTLLGDAEQDDEQKQNASGLQAPITSYSLPQAVTNNKDLHTNNVLQPLESPTLVAPNDSGIPVDMNNPFHLPDVDVGLDDLVGDADWMKDVLPQKTL
ncbi:hypothetical protein F5B22DRAFT_166058 [Xylaria bambusicola]|uniref:uncharacterized protein n=1 Tax=Xylaria bambusicola TaxID=326684 RepID=UPI002008479A|nr:uncharacterized protein F5B22DRAFT_166058 [Xylaria bambusicola]KAI0526571.1 hypothetical protein F5B22DRAFT_166058 [Xylaria bambusicola]